MNAQYAVQTGAPDAPQAGEDALNAKARNYIAAVGGKSNLTEVEGCITRLRLTVNDPSRVDQAQAKQLGASGVISVGAHNVHIIVGGEAEHIASAMRRLLSITE